MAEVKDHFIAALLFIIVITAVVSLVTLVNSGDVTGDRSDAVSGFMDSNQLTEFNRTVNIADNVTNSVNNLRSDINNLNPETTLEAITLPVAFVKTGWHTIQLIIKSFDFMTNAFGALNTFLGLPSWLPTFIILIISLLLIFAVLALIFGKEF